MLKKNIYYTVPVMKIVTVMADSRFLGNSYSSATDYTPGSDDNDLGEDDFS